MKIKSLLCSCALMVGLSGVAQAHQEVDNEGKFTVLFGGGKYATDSSRDLDDGTATEIGLGYIIDKHWAIEAIYSEMHGIDSDSTGSDVDVDMFRLDALYHFDQRNGHWTPYLAAGIGELDFDVSGGSDDDETALNFGGGVKYAITKAASLRADIRAVYGDEDSDLDTLATLGVTYVLGAQSAAGPSDADGDGVLDENDKCPGTPAGVAVDVFGCALDSDRDGVPDYLDKCPNTKQGVRVDSDGCVLMAADVVRLDLEVLFDTNKSDVKAEYMGQITRVADFMKRYDDVTAVIEGHTDSRGEASYNQGLSQRRADAVRAVLVEGLKVDGSRVTAKGYGEERPRASNDTVEGRQQNRRVVAELQAEVEKAMKK